MHAVSGSWSGQVFAVACSDGSGGKRSRSRRSKEERKGMVESFIKKYQAKNEGDFPSLSHTQKEVGGSFYTVREIVREIIQENRVLAPPKGSLKEYDHSGYLEQHVLGPLSTEPQSDFSMMDGDHVTENGSPIAREQFSSSNIRLYETDSLELDDKHILNGVSKVVDGQSDPVHDLNQQAKKEEEMNSSQRFHQSKGEIIANGGEDLEQNPHCDEPLITTISQSSNQGNDNNDLVSGQKLGEQETKRHSHEQKLPTGQIVDETKEFVQHTLDSISIETLHGNKDGSDSVEAVQHIISDVAVETFPVRPISNTSLHTDELSKALHTASVLEDKATLDDKNHSTSSVNLIIGTEDEKMAVNCQEISLETSQVSTISKETLLDTDDVKDPMPDGTKVESYPKPLASEESNVAGRKFNDKQDISLPKGSNPTLDRINLGTWEGASKNSARRETNHVLASIKAFITAFVKFWTE